MLLYQVEMIFFTTRGSVRKTAYLQRYGNYNIKKPISQVLKLRNGLFSLHQKSARLLNKEFLFLLLICLKK